MGCDVDVVMASGGTYLALVCGWSLLLMQPMLTVMLLLLCVWCWDVAGTEGLCGVYKVQSCISSIYLVDTKLQSSKLLCTKSL